MIYEEIMKNRVKYDEQIRVLQQEKLTLALENMGVDGSQQILKKSNGNSKPSTLRMPSPVVSSGKNDENWMVSQKKIMNTPLGSKRIDKNFKKKFEMRIPFGEISKEINFDPVSSRKNPLDSLRNTTDRNQIFSSIDSLQYSEDVSFF